MTQIELILYPAILILLNFYGAKLTKRGEVAPEYLCPDESRQIQAVAAVAVILHHVTQQVTGYGMNPIGPVGLFNYTGFLCTALFFFFSGYGLLTSLLTKENYLDTFLTKRLPTVLLPFFLVNLLTVLAEHFFYGMHSSAAEILSDIFGITLINSNGWFFVEITVIYLMFYLLFRLIRKKDLALFLMCCAVIALIVYSFHRGHDPEGNKSGWFRGEWWYNSTISFIFGLLYARFRRRVEVFFQKRHTLLLCAAAALSVLSFWSSINVLKRYGYYLPYDYGKQAALRTLLSQTAACLFFVLFILLLHMRVTIGNKPLRYVSRIERDLLLIHGYFVNRVFAGIVMPIFLRYALVLAASFLCTAILSPLIQRAVDQMIAFLNRKKRSYRTIESEIAEKKQKKRRRLLAAVILTAGAVYLFYVFLVPASQYILAEKEYREECVAILAAETGDEVLWGRFETDRIKPGKERLSWIVLKREADGSVLLLCKKGIAGSSYNQKHEPVTWKESDLRALLNSEKYRSMFSRYEKKCVVADDPAGDFITLLTAEEAQELFDSDEARQLALTKAAEDSGTNSNKLSKHHNWDMKGYRSSWWWLKGDLRSSAVTAPIVTVDGTIEENLKEVNRPDGAIRPLIRVRI